MRVEAGAVVDEFDLAGIGQVVARYIRTKNDNIVNWACMFTVVTPGNSELAIVHRLSAPTLPEARRSVRHAVEFLAGRAGVTGAGQRLGVPAQQQVGQPRRGGSLPERPAAFRLPVEKTPADHVPAP
jgi:hypothetical protein